MPYADKEEGKRKAAERYLKNREARRAQQKEYNDKNKAKNCERAKKYAEANKEKVKARQDEYRAEGRYADKSAEYSRKHYENGGKERQKEWDKNNPESGLAARKKYKTTENGKAVRRSWRNVRRKREKIATPPWVKMADMQKVYLAAQHMNSATGVEHHVDHIIPISHGLVSGLNVPCNLRIITAEENLKKTNTFKPFAIHHNS